MKILYTTLLFTHVLGVVVWVGGMFVLHFAVRPSAARLQEPSTRLTFLSSALGRFMAWAALAIVVVLASGLAMILIGGGFRNAHLSVHLMLAVGLVMMALYLHIRFAPFKRMRAAVITGDWEVAGANLDIVRKMVLLNLLLGIVTIAIATIGRAAL
ncbi:MAG: CopD family protein [Pseudomonadota bacterium]|nr:CopD family protein [Pseudomonadota bacterium]